MILSVKDCSKFSPQPTVDEAEWLKELSRVNASPNVIRFGYAEDEREHPIVYCDRFGDWWAGRYIGTLSLNGSQLTVEPRFGMSTIANWFEGANGAIVVDTSSKHRDDCSFIVQLLAIVWSHSFVQAARHGLPTLRRDQFHISNIVRGKLDVRGTINQFAKGQERLVSVQRPKSLENPVSKVIVAAYLALRRMIGSKQDRTWLPERACDLIPRLIQSTGANPKVPNESELRRVRYTPINVGFKNVVRLSLQIINQKGLISDFSEPGQAKGILLDVAELWELFVVAALRSASSGRKVVHGTRIENELWYLLKSAVSNQKRGRLKPDALVFGSQDVKLVVDAKYKNIEKPNREDLYQITAYLSKFGGELPLHATLIYPLGWDAAESALSQTEKANPWKLNLNQHVSFLALPMELAQAIKKLKQFNADLQASPPKSNNPSRMS